MYNDSAAPSPRPAMDWKIYVLFKGKSRSKVQIAVCGTKIFRYTACLFLQERFCFCP